MSYIIAFVGCSNRGALFPVECLREDIRVGDAVVVRRSDGKLIHATVRVLQYLNWNCKGIIECKKTECTVDTEKNIFLPKGNPLMVGVTSAPLFIRALLRSGWIMLRPPQKIHETQKVYKAVLANTNETQSSYILMGGNSIEIEIRPISFGSGKEIGISYEKISTDKKMTTHFLSHTKFNIYEWLLCYSNKFIDNDADLDRFFISQGSRDKRNEALKKQYKERDCYGFGDLGDYPDDMYLGYHMK